MVGPRRCQSALLCTECRWLVSQWPSGVYDALMCGEERCLWRIGVQLSSLLGEILLNNITIIHRL